MNTSAGKIYLGANSRRPPMFNTTPSVPSPSQVSPDPRHAVEEPYHNQHVLLYEKSEIFKTASHVVMDIFHDITRERLATATTTTRTRRQGLRRQPLSSRYGNDETTGNASARPVFMMRWPSCTVAIAERDIELG